MRKIDSSVYIADGVVLAGDITIGRESSVWYNSVLRTTGASIYIGEGSNIQDGSILHASDGKDIVIGNDVTVGHGAIVHCCTIGDNTVVGMGAIILTGAKVGSNCIIAAGALVTGGTEIPDGMVVMGSPAKIKRPLTDRDIENNKMNAKVYVDASRDEMNALVSE